MADVLIVPAAAVIADASGSRETEMVSLDDKKAVNGAYVYPPGTDFEILAELKTMSSLCLSCEYPPGFFPRRALTVNELNVEQVYNALNVTATDEEISTTDVTVACDAICPDRIVSEKAAQNLSDQLGLHGPEDRCDYQKFKEVVTSQVHKHDLNYGEALYLTFASAESSTFGKYFADWILLLIVTSTVSFILETEPVFRESGTDCDCVIFPVNSTTCAPCEPTSSPAFYYIECICIAFFTLEYLVRFFTAATVRREFIFDFQKQFQLPLIDPNSEKPRPTHLMNFVHWVTNPMVIIDLLAILPFFISLGLADSGTKVNLSFLRVLRLLRVFRVLKLAKYSQGLRTFVQVLIRSKDALTVMLFFIALAMILFGSMVYFAENGEWTVDSDHPEGAYIRNSVNQQGTEVSPYLSIASSFWWVMVTVTTVGYGDFYPTSPGGKAVGCLTMLSGVLTLALPITVIASNYANETAAQQAEANLAIIKKERDRRRRALFSKKKASLRPKTPRGGKGGLVVRRIPDTLQVLTCLAEINHQTPWPVLPLLDAEVRAMHAARAAFVDEPSSEREAALDRFLFHALTMLRATQAPISGEKISQIRREILEFYNGFQT